jgi:hypothetical protein
MIRGRSQRAGELRRLTEIERHLRLVETPAMPHITRWRPLKRMSDQHGRAGEWPSARNILDDNH